ncbi:Tetratricopeptide repeat protein 28, partial [Exaiptasia diaphana]
GHVSRNGRTVMFTPLPGAEDEAIQISNLLGVQPLIGTQATKETVLRRLQQAVSIIHFAVHGSKENGQIALAPSKPTTYSSPAEEKDCILTMKEVQESGIRDQLVVDFFSA